jgi:soluble lytic murein transglycosylase
MKKFTVGFSVTLSILNILIAVGLFFYSDHIDGRLYDCQEGIDDLNLHFSVKALQDKAMEMFFNKEFTKINSDLAKKTEQISVLEESIDPKNTRWAKIKQVRKAVVDVIEERNYKEVPNIIGLTRYASAVVEYSEKFDVPISLILGVTTRESAFNQYAISKARTPARGFMQIISSTAEECAADLGVRHYNIFNTDINVRFGVWYIRKMLDFFDNDVGLAVRAYNCGPRCVNHVLSEEWKNYPSETIKYHEVVLKWKKRYEDLGL